MEEKLCSTCKHKDKFPECLPVGLSGSDYETLIGCSNWEKKDDR